MLKMTLIALALAGFVQAALADETALVPDFTQMDWLLIEVDGARVDFAATLNLGAPGQATGQAPCNRYVADLTRDGDRFVLAAIGATRMACAQMAAEADFFQVLQGVETAAQQPGMLTLSGGGHQLVFVQPID
jgi:heat shock protein HslJ